MAVRAVLTNQNLHWEGVAVQRSPGGTGHLTRPPAAPCLGTAAAIADGGAAAAQAAADGLQSRSLQSHEQEQWDSWRSGACSGASCGWLHNVILLEAFC